MSDEDPKVDGERCQITKLEQPQRESVQSEWSRPVPRNVHIAKKDLETHGYTSGCIGCRSILVGGCRQGQSPACRARMAEISERHGQVREDTAEGQRAVEKAASDAKRARKMETEEITGIPHDNAASSSTARRTSPSELGTTERRRNLMEGRCDLEPQFKRARVGSDVDVCAVDEEDGPMDSKVSDTKTGDILVLRMMAAARSEETRYMDDIGMFEDATDEECLTNTGKPPVDTK